LGGGFGDGAAASHGVEGFEFGDKHDGGGGKGTQCARPPVHQNNLMFLLLHLREVS
jgi:hypothetical protein